MRWFRSNVHFGARLALIALALQLVLTFGHVHAVAAPSHAAPSVTALHSGGPAGDPDGLADAYCPTCALIQMSATSAPSVAPVLPLPASVNFTTLQSLAELVLEATPHIQAQARAPPLV